MLVQRIMGKRDICYKCGQKGHIARNCWKGEEPARRGKRIVTCYKCGKKGHISKQCWAQTQRPPQDFGRWSF